MSPHSEQPIVKFSEVRDAFDFVSFGQPMEHAAVLDRMTGAIYWQSDNADVSDELPDDIDDSDRYIAIPHKNDLDLGKPLALAFARKYLSEGFETVRAIFNHPGAYARFKELLAAQDQLAAWHAYEDAQSQYALRQWCADHGIALED